VIGSHPAIEAAIPDLVRVLHDAKPALESLAKTHPRPDNGSDRRAELPAIGAASGLLAVALDKRIPLLKTGEERYVLGIVLEPETVDAQDDIYSAAEVRDAAHQFMQEYRNLGLMHPRPGERSGEDPGVVPGTDGVRARWYAGSKR